MHVAHRNGFGGTRGLRTGWVVWGVALLLAGVAAACEPAEVEASARVEASAGEVAPTGEGSRRASAASGAASPLGDGKAPTGEGSRRASAASGAASPLGGLVPPAPGQEELVGVVAERLPAGGYTYLRLEPERGEPRWVVTMRRDVGEGDRVRVDSLGSRHDFYSRRLDRRFAELVFGVVEVEG